MTRNQMIFALTKYELEFLNSNPEHLDLVTDFFVHGGYNNYSDGMLSSIYTDKIQEANHA